MIENPMIEGISLNKAYLVDLLRKQGLTEIAWHYTPHSSLEGIIKAGALLPCSGITGQIPAVWFLEHSMNPLWHGVTDHQREAAKGRWLRFGYEGCGLTKLARFPSILDRAPFHYRSEGFSDMVIARSEGCLISLKPIGIDELSVIQASDDDGESWSTVFINPDCGKVTMLQ